MKIEKLIKMANDISNFFNADSDKEVAAEGVKRHIVNNWEPRMLEAILTYVKQDGSGLTPLAKSALTKIAGQ